MVNETNFLYAAVCFLVLLCLFLAGLVLVYKNNHDVVCTVMGIMSARLDRESNVSAGAPGDTMDHFYFTARVYVDQRTGKTLGARLGVRDPASAVRCVEKVPGIASVYLDTSGRLVSLRLSAPCALAALSEAVAGEPPAVRDFVASVLPRDMVS